MTPRTPAARALLREFHRSYFSEPHEESECYWTETVLAIEAEAAPASGLDVERLARALHTAECECDYWPGEHQPKWRELARVIAAVYEARAEAQASLARLAAPEAAEGEGT